MFSLLRFRPFSSSAFLSTAVFAASAGLLTAAEDVVFEDFEGDDYGLWTTTSSAFGAGPVAIPNSLLSAGSLADWDNKILDSFSAAGLGNGEKGVLVSPDFVITHDYIHFLIGGGGGSGTARMRLLDANTNRQIKISTGSRSNRIDRKSWNVSADIGRSVRIEVEDKRSGSWSHMLIDDIVFSDQVAQKTLGVLSTESWSGIDAFDVSSFVKDDAFFSPPEDQKITTSSFFGVAQYSGNRVRGYLTAPETGDYTFWLSASTSGELWLSSDESKYQKQRLAHFGGDTGTGSRGVAYGDGNLWDTYAAQMSEQVYLEAGQTYFLEMLSQQDHVGNGDRHISVAWARPGQDRELIPSTYLKSYIQTPDDLDDDYLPDAWEVHYGLDASDNGLIDRPHQGERGDFDSDGLSNREEYVLGTDPSNADTDGDGISDADEVRSYSTDPTQSDAPSESLVSSVDLSAYSSDLSWTVTSQGLIPSSFRGDISWDFSVPSAGYWSISAATTLFGDLYLQENIDFNIWIDGSLVAKKNLVYGQNGQANLRALTPYLSEGTHTLKIDIDNFAARRVVTFQSIQILEPQGLDLDNDGSPDWITSQLYGANTLSPYQSLSRTSPAFLEGNARMVNQVTINGNSVQPGLDGNHWFTGLDLQEQGPTPFTIDLEGNLNESGSIQWLATDVLDSETLTIRVNDKLKLTASTASGSSSLSLPDVNWAGTDGAVATQSSTESGNPVASRAIDGNTSGVWNDNSVMKTKDSPGSWWQVDLGLERSISQVSLWNRNIAALDPYLSNFRISVLDSAGSTVISQDFYTSSGYAGENEIWTLPNPVLGSVVKVEKLGKGRQNSYTLSLAEVQVYGGGIDASFSSATDYITYQFQEAGTKTVTATAADGSTGALTVHVKQASFSPIAEDLLSNTVGTLNFSPSLVSSDLYFEGGDSVRVNQNYTITSTNIALQAGPTGRGRVNLIARLYENGPILGTQPLNIIAFADAIQTGQSSTFFSRDFSGYIQVSSPIVATDLPVGGTVVATIHRGGITFLDGTKTMTLSSDDFINGVYHLDFLFPVGMDGGYCHYIDIYDRNGGFVARR